MQGEEGHKVVRGRWAPPPTEGKGSTEGQRQLQTATRPGVMPSPRPPSKKKKSNRGTQSTLGQ